MPKRFDQFDDKELDILLMGVIHYDMHRNTGRDARIIANKLKQAIYEAKLVRQACKEEV